MELGVLFHDLILLLDLLYEFVEILRRLKLLLLEVPLRAVTMIERPCLIAAFQIYHIVPVLQRPQAPVDLLADLFYIQIALIYIRTALLIFSQRSAISDFRVLLSQTPEK